MGELIELLFKAVGWLVVVSLYAAWNLARSAARAVVYTVTVTARLVRQSTTRQYSPDRRYWWNGRVWIEMLPPAMWIIPGAALGILALVVVGFNVSLNAQPNSNPGSVAAAVASPIDSNASIDVATSPSPSPLPPTASASPVPSPTPRAAPPPPLPAPAPRNTCGAPANPFGYDFCSPGNVIYGPPSNFCSYFNCIKSFWQSTKGYVDECQDGTYSHSGGRQGACSYHGGELRPLYSH